ncbi:flagellar hook-associated protein FlgK [Parafrigoribacterium mesophilum]|uniref:flagellar hook-associated protein FlgK n=1 Tax=Parafrigoribacterium mesophilum TaxID=433646 RepID=UPI0031FBAF9B
MSTFSGLNTAYTGLTAARQGLNVVGQNIANVNTDGYTRQRATITATGALANTGYLTTAVRVGQGVSVDAIARLGDIHLDTRVRATTAISAYTDVRADAMSAIEGTLQEPGENGLAAQLQAFWADWQDLSNRAGEAPPAQVLLQQANVVAAQIAYGYNDIKTQWSQLRTDVGSMVAQVNDAAVQVADLNARIRSTVAAGGSPNELIDQRSTLMTTIAGLAGGSIHENSDGTIDVLIGGNAIVSGDTARSLVALGPTDLEGATATDQVRVAWTHNPAQTASLDGGRLAGAISVLAAADASGPGGELVQAAASYNEFADALAQSVNTAHGLGVTPSGAAGGAFFDFAPGLAHAAGLTVVPTSAADIATGAPGAGPLDGSNADAISQIGQAVNSPDSIWASFVSRIGAATRTELQRASLADLTATSASNRQLANSTVDLDEENINLLSFQHAYQGAARVMTAVDEMLDTLINHTGLVGR